MGILDALKHKSKEMADQAGGLGSAVKGKTSGVSGQAGEVMSTAKDLVSHGLDSAGHFVDSKTGGKYTRKIGASVGKGKQIIGRTGPGATDDPHRKGPPNAQSAPTTPTPDENDAAQQARATNEGMPEER